MVRLAPVDLDALREVSAKLGVPEDWLSAVINFETAGTWDPLKKNPLSSARGLIQFLDATAKGLGYAGSLDLVTRHPSVSSQLRGPVLKYFQQWTAPARSKQEFYFRVFLPAYARAPLDTVIYSDDAAKRARFQAANPGIVTVGDYFRKLEKSFARFKKTASEGGGIILALVVVGLFVGRLLRS